MKQLYIFILTFVICLIGKGQSYTVFTPTIIGNSNWNTKIITKYYCLSNAYKIGHSYSINYDNNIINLTSCYTGGGLFPVTSTIIDTINIGLLPAGNYNLNYTVFISSSYSTCVSYDTIVSNHTFYAGPNSLKKSTHEISFSLYPNPVKDYMNIVFSESIPIGRVEIMNTLGEKVLELVSAKTADVIDLSSLPQGVYLVNVFTDGYLLTKKLIKG